MQPGWAPFGRRDANSPGRAQPAEYETEAMEKYKCSVCGYVDDHVPDNCPVCGAPAQKFVQVDEK